MKSPSLATPRAERSTEEGHTAQQWEAKGGPVSVRCAW